MNTESRRHSGWPRSLAGLLTAVLLLLAAACSPSRPDGQPQATAAEPLLAFTATTLDGQQFDGMSLSGKPVVLWFWAPWCPTCLGQAPGVRAAVDQHASKVNIVGVAGLDTASAMPEFVRLAKLEGMTHLADETGTVWKRFEVAAQSIFVFIDASGRMTFRGRLDADEIPGRVAALIT